jgi:hypothetical protein
MVAPAAHTTTPASTDVNNGAAINTGVRLTVASTKVADGVAFYVPGTNTGTYTGAIYETTSDDDPGGSGTGNLLQSGTLSSGSCTAGTWAVIPLDSTVNLSVGTVYTARVHSSSGRIVATSTGLASAITGNGVTLLAAGTDPNPPGLGSMANGVFTEGAAGYPNSTFNNTDYFPDLSIQSGQSVTVGTASETDTAGTISHTKARTVGVAADTSTAGTITQAHAYSVQPATEADTAGTVTARHSRTLGVASTTDTAGAVTAARAYTVGVATETDGVGSVALARTIGRAVEVDTAPAVVLGGATASLPARRVAVVTGARLVAVVTGARTVAVVSDG